MKSIKIVSLVLALLMLGTMLIACDKKEVAVNSLPKDEYYKSWDENTVTVSFKIQFDETKKDEEGNKYIVPKVLVEAKDYVYKSHKAPTILNIVTNYLAIETNYTYRIDSNLLKKIGKYPNTKDQKGMVWAFGRGIDDFEKINGSMSTFNVKEENCYEFTIYLEKMN